MEAWDTIKAGAKIAPAPFDVQFEIISPERAREMLATNRLDNRKLSSTRVARYKDDVQEGFWDVTHQGIAFDEHGNLMDGQHRLQAIAEGTVDVLVMVCYGVPSDTFWLVDGGFARNAQSFLEGPYRVQRSALGRTLMRIEEADGWARSRGDLPVGSGQYATHRILSFLEENEKVRNYGLGFSAAAKRAAKSQFKGTSTVGLLLGGYIAGESNWVRWWEDVEALVQGDGVENGNPLRALFRMGEVGGNMTNVNYMRGIYTGVKYRNGEPLRQLRESNYSEVYVGSVR